jgi:hypothetical protein
MDDQKNKELQKKLYKGPKFWTLTGSILVDLVNFRKSIYKPVVVQKVSWDELASKGADLIIAEHNGGVFPERGTVNWHPYYDLPVFPEFPEDKIIKKD